MPTRRAPPGTTFSYAETNYLLLSLVIEHLVHGRADERIRLPATLSALSEPTSAGYVGLQDGEALHNAYAFLRQLEHRIQLHRLRRTHLVPDDEASLRRLGRSLGR